MADILSLTGFLLALSAIFIGGEALRRFDASASTPSDAVDPRTVDMLRKRIDALERLVSDLKNRDRLAGYRFDPELSDSERFAPSHHVLKHHYLA